MLSLAHYLVFGAILFSISVIGIFLNRKNVIVLLMAIELMLLAVNTNFIAFSNYLGDYGGQVFVFFILTVAAAESAIGLAILVLLFRNLDTISGFAFRTAVTPRLSVLSRLGISAKEDSSFHPLISRIVLIVPSLCCGHMLNTNQRGLLLVSGDVPDGDPITLE